MQNGDLAPGDVRVAGAKVSHTRHSALPNVLVAGQAVEIRGDAAQVVREALEEWLANQQRRIEFLRRGDSETVRRLGRRMNVVIQVLEAWEGVLAVPVTEIEPDKPAV